jgi:hypothetical protein
MAFQMVYTSVRSGLVAGRSGFCTAARHREIKESLVARLEDFSAEYDRGATAGGPLPVVYQHRIVTIRDQRYHVLMRLGDAGNDYTGRTNHIAHSVVIEPSEIAELSLSPAEAILALSQRGFWRSHYDEPARFFGVGDTVDLGGLPRCASLPAARWRERTGSHANAAQLFDSGGPADAGIAVSGTAEADSAGILALFAESLLLLDPGRSSGDALWSVPFTTVLQSSAERSQFRWCGIVAHSGPADQEARAGRRILSPGSPLNPPVGAFADIAEGRTPRFEPAATVALETPLAGTAPASADPGELAGVRTPAAGPVPERPAYAVPLSLEDPRRRQRTAKARKNPARTALLCAAAVVVMLAMAGGLWFWSGNKEVWEEAKRIGKMAERGEWEKIQKEFNGPKLDSEKHPKWAAIANAMARYEEIEKNPDQFRKTVSGMNTIDEAIGTIQQEWRNAEIDSSDPLVKQVEEKRIAAIESAKKWKSSLSNAKNKINELQKDLEKHLKASPELVSKQANKLAGSLKALEADCENWNKASLESASLSLTVVKESILPALAKLEQIDRQYPVDKDLKQLSEDAAVTSNHLSDEIRKIEALVNKEKDGENFRKAVSEVCNDLMARLQKLSFEGGFAREEPPPVSTKAAPPKPDPAVTEAVGAKNDKIPPRTFLIEAQTGGVIDLSGFDGSPQAFPREFVILPVSSLLGGSGVKGVTVEEKVTNFYYVESIRILGNPEGLKLKKEEKESKEIEFWNSFRGGFILRLRKGSDRADDVRYLVLDKIPGGQGSETLEPWAMKPCETFLKRGSPGEVEISESVVAILKRITRVTGDPPKYRLTLAGDFPLKSPRTSGWVEDPSEVRLPLIKDIQEAVANNHEEKKLYASAVEASKSIETRYANLGRDLFPQFFESRAPNEVASKVDKRNPAGGLPPVVHGTFAEFAKGARLQLGSVPEYMKYVKSLFASLEALSADSQQYKSAHRHIEKYIEKGSQVQPVNGRPKEAVAWYELTRAWNASSGSNPPPSPSDGKAIQIDRDAKQIQMKYFEDFFRVWNDRFSEEAVKKLINELNLIEKAGNLRSLVQLDSELERLESMKSRLENPDFTDDGKYTLELLLDGRSSTSKDEEGANADILLIRGAR